MSTAVTILEAAQMQMAELDETVCAQRETIASSVTTVATRLQTVASSDVSVATRQLSVASAVIDAATAMVRESLANPFNDAAAEFSAFLREQEAQAQAVSQYFKDLTMPSTPFGF